MAEEEDGWGLEARDQDGQGTSAERDTTPDGRYLFSGSGIDHTHTTQTRKASECGEGDGGRIKIKKSDAEEIEGKKGSSGQRTVKYVHTNKLGMYGAAEGNLLGPSGSRKTCRRQRKNRGRFCDGDQIVDFCNETRGRRASELCRYFASLPSVNWRSRELRYIRCARTKYLRTSASFLPFEPCNPCHLCPVARKSPAPAPALRRSRAQREIPGQVPRLPSHVLYRPITLYWRQMGRYCSSRALTARSLVPTPAAGLPSTGQYLWRLYPPAERSSRPSHSSFIIINARLLVTPKYLVTATQACGYSCLSGSLVRVENFSLAVWLAWAPTLLGLGRTHRQALPCRIVDVQ